MNEAESLQTSFARAVLRLPPGSPNLFVRAELGLERLSARWSKLRMGYVLAQDLGRSPVPGATLRCFPPQA